MKIYLKNALLLSREELRQLKGGDAEPEDSFGLIAGGKCDSTCSSDAVCKTKQENSYCTYLMCDPGNGIVVRRYSCQWIND